jgi:hypothetical protein
VRFIEANKERPFYLYFPHYGVHTPLQAKPEAVEKYRAKIKSGMGQKNATYAAMVESIDQSVGRVLATLDELKLSEKTIVVFTSDNGGLLESTSNKPLRVGKGSAYEGGVRVPLLVRWPGVVRPGSASETPVIAPIGIRRSPRPRRQSSTHNRSSTARAFCRCSEGPKALRATRSSGIIRTTTGVVRSPTAPCAEATCGSSSFSKTGASSFTI